MHLCAKIEPLRSKPGGIDVCHVGGCQFCFVHGEIKISPECIAQSRFDLHPRLHCCGGLLISLLMYICRTHRYPKINIVDSEDRLISGEDGCALQNMFQFAHIARPQVRFEF